MAEEADSRPLAGNSQDEGCADDQQERAEKTGLEKEESTMAVGSDVDDFFASGGSQKAECGGNSNQQDIGHHSQHEADPADVSVELDDNTIDSEPKMQQAADGNSVGGVEEDDAGVALSQTGDEGHRASDLSDTSAASFKEDDQQKSLEETMESHREAEDGSREDVDRNKPDPATSKTEQQGPSQNSGKDDGNSVDVEEDAGQSLPTDETPSSQRSASLSAENEGKDGGCTGETGESERRAERMGSDGDLVQSADRVDTAADCDSGENVGDTKGDVQELAQGLVQHVLDNVMQAEAETGEEEGDGDGRELTTATHFPALDKVDLNSEDWNFDDHGKQTAVHGDLDIGNGMKEVNDADAEPEERELLGESQSLYMPGHDRGAALETPPHSPGERCDRHQQPTLFPSPKAGYPLNYNNYKVCRILSPGVKECLILETGEQVVYDYSHSAQCTETSQSGASPDQAKEKVKRSLFPEKALSSGEQDQALPQLSETTNSTDKTAATASSPPKQHSTQHKQPSGDDGERSGEVNETHDGSYLWLQRQVEWRAGSSKIPATHSTRDGVRSEWKEPRPRSGHQEGRTGDSSQDYSGEGRLGTSADVSGSMTSPGAIPNFNTLRDQQVSWLSMYRMLEEQHRTQLQAQYAEHQRAISDMQRHLEGELISQQQNMRQKLDCHREALREQSTYTGYSKAKDSSWNSRQSSQSQSTEQSLARSSLLDLREADGATYTDRQTSYSKGGSRSGQGTSHRSQWSSQGSSAADSGGEKQLHGGVYSSPMPLAKTRTSLKEVSSSETDSRQRSPHSSAVGRWSQDSKDDYTSLHISAQHEPHSPRSQLNLREKHAKHMSDLRSYYEAEIQDLRHKLNTLAGGAQESVLALSSTNRETARERILQQENQTLRHQLRDVQDTLDDSRIRNRDLEQKLQGLEIRAADYSDRYEESQHNVLKLKTRLEELHSYAKDRESMLDQAQSSERRQTSVLQEAYKAQEELKETMRRDKSALKRLLDKYEMLEKDYNALKETSTDLEQKLFETRTENVQLNKKISQLELENKRFAHDNDNMRHRLAVSGSLPMSRQDMSEPVQQRIHYVDHEDLNGYSSHSLDRHSAKSVTRRDTTPPRTAGSDEEDSDMGKSDSPLLRAERELMRLQQTLGRGEFVPRLHNKKAPSSHSLGSANAQVTIIDALSSSSTANSGAGEGGGKRGVRTVGAGVKGSKAGGGGGGGGHSRQSVSGRSPARSSSYVPGQSASVSSPTRFDVALSGSRSPRDHGTVAKKAKGKEVPRESGVDTKSSTRSMSKGEENQSVDATLKRLRSGAIVSRPQWEDVYTSLAKPAQPDKTSSVNMTQEEMLRDRVRSIDQLEQRYDALQMDKRKLESQLNKVPAHGRDRKSRREKELLEEKLDSVDHELGSLRMTLKRYQVLKSTM